MKAPLYFEGSCKDAVAMGENAFMFYTGAPQNSIRLPLKSLHIQEGLVFLKEHNIDISNVIVHAPYLINLANTTKESIYDMSKEMLLTELSRSQAFGTKVLVLHPGSHVGAGSEIGLKNVVKGLDEVLDIYKGDVKIAIETMAGKGSEVGKTFEEVAYIINNVKEKERVGVCLDTCHINDAGYPINDVDKVIDEFDRIVGLKHLLVIHLNDSLNPIGAHKDRHANIGYGTIGFDTLLKYAYHPKLEGVVKILETPYVDDNPPYKQEIDMLRNKEFKKLSF